MKTASVPSRWLRLHPDMRMDAKFWVAVMALLPRREASDDEAVRAAIRQVESDTGCSASD